MSLFITNSLPMNRPLLEVVRDLEKELPVGANSVSVNVVIENLVHVYGAKVSGYSVYFLSPIPGHEAGTVYLTYGVGNYESVPVEKMDTKERFERTMI